MPLLLIPVLNRTATTSFLNASLAEGKQIVMTSPALALPPSSVQRRRPGVLAALLSSALATLCLSAAAQSTLGSLHGAVHDPSGALVPNATIVVHSTATGVDRTATTNAGGEYNVLNLEPGTYELRVGARGFSPEVDTGVAITAREQLTYDIALAIRGEQTVTVNADTAGTIDTTDASISATLSPQAVLDLPANYRGAGSTSPLNVIQTLPGIQPDSGSFPPQPSASPNPSIKFSIQGGLPSQSETTVDGISAQNQTTNNIQSDAFPSAESIAEIRVDGVNNNAEYGQPGEITTVTKSGTNRLHGSAFWYFQNSAFDAIPYGSLKPKKVANDFGGTLGGPVVIPHLFNGRNHLFFFGTYEGLRFPQSRTVQYLVPTVLEKSGDFSQELTTLANPFTGGVYANAKLTPNPSSAALLSLFPDPNLAVNSSVASVLASSTPYNYIANKRNDINSNQFDARLDTNFAGGKGTAFARYTQKNIGQIQPESLNIPNATAYAHYRIFAAAASYAFTPHVVNEARFGFTLEEDGTTTPLDGAALTDTAHFNGLATTFPFNGLPFLGFQYLTSDTTSLNGSRLNAVERSRVFQYVDNVTLQLGNHTVRVGGDVRTLNAFTPLSISGYGDNYGSFFFSQAGSFTGNEFADFLAGVPQSSETATVTSDNNGSSAAYAVYVEDNWKATPRLNLTFGARYELHPGFHATNGDIGNFDPSVPLSGRLLYPTGYANLLSVPELASFNACATAGVNNPAANNAIVNGAPCTPVLTNDEAGLPSSLRTTPRLRLEPRFGFAFRPTSSGKLVLRGGAGYYNITTSGALFYALTGTLQSNLQSFYNTVTPGVGPAFSFPNVSSASSLASTPYGSGVFYSAVDTNWHDPYSLQSNLSVDEDLGHSFALRVSYIGLKTWHLVWQPELNQLPLSSTTIATSQPRAAFPFPNFYQIYNRSTEAQASYHSGQVELNRHFTGGLSFSSAYTFAKNLSDNQGTYGADSGQPSFVDEQGGYDATDANNRHLDYGNVTGTRRHRWISSGVYQLPVGRGRRFGGSMNRATDLAVGGWQVSSILLLQSGPFLTAFVPSGVIDPSGTGSGTLFYRSQRPDRIANGNRGPHTRNQWFNTGAFTCPGTPGGISTLTAVDGVSPCQVGSTTAPIGRFGTESVGDLRGPGTVVLSAGLSKIFPVTEGLKLRAEGTFTNILNHTNLADPNLDVTDPSFGVITTARGSDFGGNRTGQVSLKLEF